MTGPAVRPNAKPKTPLGCGAVTAYRDRLTARRQGPAYGLFARPEIPKICALMRVSHAIASGAFLANSGRMRNTLKSCLVVMGVLACASLGCRTRAPETPAVEAPAPPIEPALAAGSELVDARADQLVRQMSDLLAATNAFELNAEEIYDEVPEQSPRQQLTSVRQVTLRRPDRLSGDTTGDAVNRAFWYDGRTFSVLDKEQFVWTDGNVPPTIDEALDWVFEKTGTVIPLADFLYANPYERLMGDVQRGVYLGIHDVGGVPCHHLSFEQATIDWQIWIDAGPKPLPRKLVIAYKTEDEVPQYTVTIRHWNLTPNTPDARFHFSPPAGAKRIDVPALKEEGR